MESFRITGEQTLSRHWGKLSRISFETLNEAGVRRVHHNELYDTGNGVAALLYNRKRRTLLLTEQFRIATVRNGNPRGIMTEVCAGKVEGGTSDDTMLREIREETGYQVASVSRVMSVFASPGAYAERLELYVAHYEHDEKTSAGGGLEEEGEDIKVREVTFDDALAMVDDGRIWDAKTVILLQYAALKRLFD